MLIFFELYDCILRTLFLLFLKLLSLMIQQYLYNTMKKIFKFQNSKLAQQEIHKFNYYLQDCLTDLFKNSPNFQQLRIAQAPQFTTVFLQKREVSGQFIFSKETIQESIKRTYCSNSGSEQEILKINQNIFSKKKILAKSFVANTVKVQQIVQFAFFYKSSSVSLLSQQFEVYVIHHCPEIQQQSEQLKWLHFVEQYTINQHQIRYCLLAKLSGRRKYLNWGCKISLFKKFITESILINEFQGHLLELGQGMKTEQKLSNDPAYSDSHKVSKKIPIEFFKTFHALKKQFGEENQKDIGRFLIAKNFKVEQTRKSLIEYFAWKDQIMKKYKWEDFEEFHSKRIFVYLGEDYMGRPVVFHQSNALKIDEVDLQKYCVFFLYFLEIYIPSKMRGNVYQMTIIGDSANVTSENYKLSVTKQNILSSLKYCAQRQFKLIVVNSGFVTHMVYKLVKPIMPKNTQSKIIGLGTDVQQNLTQLLELMHEDIIPKSLGGRLQLF